MGRIYADEGFSTKSAHLQRKNRLQKKFNATQKTATP
jgi:hypothetical protein